MAEDVAAIWADDDYRFHGQRADERVMLVRNQHPVTLLPSVVISLVSLVVPYLAVLWTDGRATLYTVLVYGILLVLLFGRHLYAYYNGICILTNQRILNVNQRGFFSRRITEAELTRIQDVSTDVKGVLQTLFGFGDVTIRTASKDSLLILGNIGNPYEVQQAIVRSLKGLKVSESE